MKLNKKAGLLSSNLGKIVLIVIFILVILVIIIAIKGGIGKILPQLRIF